MPPRPARRQPRARHHDTTFRPVQMTGLGNDAWQRQADAAAWSAVSGMPPERYLGWLEPIPVPEDLRAKLREAGAAMAAMPSQERLTALLTLAHEAAYGRAPAPGEIPPPREMPRAAPRRAAGADQADWWGDIAPKPENPSAAALEAFALEAFAALQTAEPDPEHEAERAAIRAEGGGEWW